MWWFILFITAIVVAVAISTRYYLRRVRLQQREAFQDTGGEEEVDPIYTIMNATEEDPFQVELPRPLATRAYALLGPGGPTTLFGPTGPLGETAPTPPANTTTWPNYPAGPRLSSPATIRSILLSNLEFYTDLFNRMPANEVARNTAWNADPATRSCEELARLSQQFKSMIDELRPKMMDISGALGLYIDAKTRNISYQQTLQEQCKRNMSDACLQLAKLDESILSIMPEFEKSNEEIFNQTITLTENYNIINIVRDTLQCRTQETNWPLEVSGPSGPLGFNPDLTYRSNLGIIDTATMRNKLSELSPYYISPAVLNYVTQYLVRKDELDTKVSNTATQIEEMKQLTDQINTF